MQSTLVWDHDKNHILGDKIRTWGKTKPNEIFIAGSPIVQI
jgi:hypothetical protein